MDDSKFYEKPKRGLVYDVHAFLNDMFWDEERIENNYDKAYRLAGMSYLALKTKDEHLWSYLKNSVENSITKNGRLKYKLVIIDQVPIGLVFINLYRETKDRRYMLAAKHVYDFIKTQTGPTGIIPYRKECPNQFVDGIGMTIPFLMEYYSVTKDSTALSLSHKNMSEYYEYGVDHETLIPAHGYNYREKIKVGSSNWGRGIGWWCLALSFCHNEDLLRKTAAIIKGLPMTQFPYSSPNVDSSSILFFELILQTAGEHPLNLDIIRSKLPILSSGEILRCSGDTYDFNNYSYSYSSSQLTQGLFCLICSQYCYENWNNNASAPL